MGYRHDGRILAVQYLFQHDLNGEDLDEALVSFWSLHEKEADSQTRAFAEELIRGVVPHVAESDERIKKYSENWDFHRIAKVDLNVMRLAIYEMLHREDIPPVVSINEAVEIAKKLSTAESGKFVNGILDKVKLELNRDPRAAKGGAPGPKKPAGKPPRA